MHALENRSGEDSSWISWESGELLEIEGVGLETWGGMRRRLPHTNPYQEHKNRRPIRRVGLIGRAKNEANQKGDREDSHHREGDQISTRNQAFHRGELKLPWRGPGSWVPHVEGEETKRKLFFAERGVTGRFLKADRLVWPVLPTSLTGLHWPTE
jgi:hypothetical protein